MQPKEPRHHTNTSEFLLKMYGKEQGVQSHYQQGSCENIVSTALVDYLKLEIEPHPYPYTIELIKKGPCIQVMNLSYIPTSIGKFYQDSATFDVVDMDVCHIL